MMAIIMLVIDSGIHQVQCKGGGIIIVMVYYNIKRGGDKIGMGCKT